MLPTVATFDLTAPEIRASFLPYRSLLPQKHSTGPLKFVRENNNDDNNELTDFWIDKNSNKKPSFTPVVEISEYERVTDTVLGSIVQDTENIQSLSHESTKIPEEDGEYIKNEIKRTCFNCGLSGHKYQLCPSPCNPASIAANRKTYEEENPTDHISFTRYYTENEKRVLIEKFKPGVISDALKDALGILDFEQDPPYYHNMRIHGYPPGYLGFQSGEDPLKFMKKDYKNEWDVSRLKFYGTEDGNMDDLDHTEIKTLSRPAAENIEVQIGPKNVQLVFYPGLNLGDFHPPKNQKTHPATFVDYGQFLYGTHSYYLRYGFQEPLPPGAGTPTSYPYSNHLLDSPPPPLLPKPPTDTTLPLTPKSLSSHLFAKNRTSPTRNGEGLDTTEFEVYNSESDSDMDLSE